MKRARIAINPQIKPLMATVDAAGFALPAWPSIELVS
jgi:hypothetical protein